MPSWLVTVMASADGCSFYLSFAKVKQYLGIHRQRAQRLMKMLVADGLLEIVRGGVRGHGGRDGSATRWRYHGKSEQEGAEGRTEG